MEVYLVSLDSEGEEGEDTDTDCEGGGEGVDAAVDWAEYPLSGKDQSVKTMKFLSWHWVWLEFTGQNGFTAEFYMKRNVFENEENPLWDNISVSVSSHGTVVSICYCQVETSL